MRRIAFIPCAGGPGGRTGEKPRVYTRGSAGRADGLGGDTQTGSDRTQPALRYAQEPGSAAVRPGSSAYLRTGFGILGRPLRTVRVSRHAAVFVLSLLAAFAGRAPAQEAVPATGPAETGTTDAEAIAASVRQLEQYDARVQVSGTVHTAGSSTVTNLIRRWAAAFGRVQPGVEVVITGGGSGAGIPALTDGRADVAAMSRPATAPEVRAFAAKFGYGPTAVAIGVDAVAVFVNRDNPLRAVTLAQADALFGREPRHGVPRVEAWGALGLGGAWRDRAPARFGSGPGQGSYALFKSDVLGGGSFRFDVHEERVTSSLVQGVAADPSGVGYTSIFYDTPAIRPLALVGDDGRPCLPTYTNCVSLRYPLARSLLIYLNRPPGQPLPASVREFARFALSRYGQQIAADDGNFPVDVTLQKQGDAQLR